MNKKGLIIILTLIILLCFDSLVLAYNENYGKKININSEKGTYTYYQVSRTNEGLYHGLSLTRTIPIDRKAYIIVDKTTSYSSWGSTATVKVYNSNKELMDGWRGIIYPQDNYKVYTYAYIGTFGHADAIATIDIYPYYNLNYTETGGQGQVKVYLSGNSTPIKTFYDDGTENAIAYAGQEIYLEAIPEPGYHFVRWEGSVSGTSTTSPGFIMNKDKNVTAVFELDQVTLPDKPITLTKNTAIFDWNPINYSQNMKYSVALEKVIRVAAENSNNYIKFNIEKPCKLYYEYYIYAEDFLNLNPISYEDGEAYFRIVNPDGDEVDSSRIICFLPGNPVTKRQKKFYNVTEELIGEWQIEIGGTNSKSGGWAEAKIYNYFLTTAETNQMFSDLSAKYLYRAQVRPFDGENMGVWTVTNYFSPPPASIIDTALQIKADSEHSNGMHEYRVEITVPDIDTAGYIFERNMADSNGNFNPDSWVEIANLSYLEMSGNSFIFTDRNVDKGQEYRYRVCTENALGERSEYTEYANAVTIPNIPVPADLDLIINIDNQEITLDEAEPVYTNTSSFTLNIPPEDVEGESITYKLYYSRDGIEQGNYFGEGYGTGESLIEFSGEGEYRWYLLLNDGYDITRIPAEDTDSFTYITDTTPPAVSSSSYTIKDTDDSSHPGYNLENPTNNRDVLINIGDTSLNDASSGLKTIYFWNEDFAAAENGQYSEPVVFYNYNEAVDDTGSLREEIKNEIESADDNTKAGIKVDFDSNEMLPITNLPWILTEGIDGNRTICLKVEDRAGNSKIVHRNLLLDTTPPAMPSNITHSYSTEENKDYINFSWTTSSLDADDFNALYSYNLDGEDIDGNLDISNITEVTGETGQQLIKGTARLSVSALPANHPVTISINSIDKAGNISDGIDYDAYTKAEPGQVAEVSGGFDTSLGDSGNHYLKWELVSEGIASYHRLEYGTLSGGSFTKTGELSPDNNNQLLLIGLGPHASYAYRLASYNNSDYPTYTEPNEWQVPNTPPSIPALNSPAGYTVSYNNDGELNFSYEEAFDPDTGDIITYQVYFGEGETPVTYEQLDLINNPLTRDVLAHGQTYSWYLEVADNYGGSNRSQPVSFIVDKVAPELEVEEARRPYTNQQALSITTRDDLSDIKGLRYMVNSQTGQEVELTQEPDGSWTGEIPLSEGEYSIQVTAYDHGGNSKQVDLNNLKVDQTNPVISEIDLGLTQSGTGYISYQQNIPITFTASDPLSGNFASGHNRFVYWLVKNYGDEAAQEGSIKPISPRISNYNLDLDLSSITADEYFTNGQEYYLATAVMDQAGNISRIHYSDPIYFDLTPPALSLSIEGLISYGGGYYLASPEDLVINTEASDSESGIEATEYNLQSPANGSLMTTWGDWNTVRGTLLTPGEKYKLLVRATNGVGNSVTGENQEFIYDNTPPVIELFDGPTATMVSGETVIFTINAGDNETTVSEYLLAIGTAPGETQLTSKITGNQEGWLKINPVDGAYRLLLPQVESGTYYPALRVSNPAGLTAEMDGDAFEIDNTRERVVVTDEGPYTMFSDRLSASWSYTGDREPDSYRYRLVENNGTEVYTWQTLSNEQTEVTVTGLDLATDGTEYRFEVQAVFSTDTDYISGISPGVKVDTSPPVITSFTTPEYCTSDNMIFNWTGQDDLSGVVDVQIALGSDYNLTDITGGWVNIEGNKLSCDASGQPLNLVSGTRYYPVIRLINGAGLQTDLVGKSFVIDDTLPPIPVVVDQGNYINTGQPMKFHWTWTEIDPESGNGEYYWTVLVNTTDPENANWYSSNGATSLDLADIPIDNEFYRDSQNGEYLQSHGNIYYLAVKVINGAGLESIGISDGILADETAPIIPVLKLIDAVNVSDPENYQDTNYISSTESLTLWINSYDLESGVTDYLYAYGLQEEVDTQERSSSESPIINLTNPDIQENVVTVFAGECFNEADLISQTGYSTGVILDTGAPKIIDVNGSVAGEKLVFDWDVDLTSVISPIAGYQVALVDDPTITPDAGEWIDVGLDKTCVYDATRLEDGHYWLKVRGYNAAGTFSRSGGGYDEIGTSPEIVLDRTVPEVKALIHPQYVDRQLTVTIEATDNLSGINTYQYALGTLVNPTLYSGKWVELLSSNKGTVDAIKTEIDTSNIPTGSKFFVWTRVKDNANLWSVVKNSNLIIADHSKPEGVSIGIINGHHYTNDPGLIGDIEIDYSDPESGVTAYRLSLATEENGEWLTSPEFHDIKDFNGTLTLEQELNEGEYYLILEVVNGAGLSKIVYSQEPVVTVDITAPVLTFIAAEEIVLNKPDDLPASIEFNLSEKARVSFNLVDGQGNSEPVPSAVYVPVKNYFLFKKNEYDTYTLKAIPVDLAGNTGEERVALIRINQPPVITLNDIYTTPGKELELTAEVIDPDRSDEQAGNISYQWTTGHEGAILTGKNPVYAYPELGEYLLTLTCTDVDGGISSRTAAVYVENTRSGPLYSDEKWSGEHEITGDVIVPPNLTLTILPGTSITVRGLPVEGGSNHGLIVEGSLRIGDEASSEQVSIRLDENGTGYWKGLYITGDAVIHNLLLEDAERGITAVGNSSVLVNNSLFRNNKVGLHIYGSTPEIRETVFENNLLYGIKEDNGGRPLVSNCLFAGNGIDYYHQELTGITMEELNSIGENHGNRSEYNGGVDND